MTINNIKNQSIFSNISDETTIARFRPGEKDPGIGSGGGGGGTGVGLGSGAPGGFSIPQLNIPIKIPSSTIFGRPMTAPKIPAFKVPVSPVNTPLRNPSIPSGRGAGQPQPIKSVPQNNGKKANEGWNFPFWPWKKPSTTPQIVPTPHSIKPFRQNPSAVQPKKKQPEYCKMTTTINEYITYNSGIYNSDGSVRELPWAQKTVALQVKIESPFAIKTEAKAVIIGGDKNKGKPVEFKSANQTEITASALAIRSIHPKNLTPSALKQTGVSLVEKVNRLEMDILSEGSCYINGQWKSPTNFKQIRNKFQNDKKVR
jgi:hypothetical protein